MPSSYQVRLFEDIRIFSASVTEFLGQNEAQNNLLLGLISLLSSSHFEVGKPFLSAVVHGDSIAGIAIRTGDNRALICSEMPKLAAEALAPVVKTVEPRISRLNGPDATIAHLARFMGKSTTLKMSLGIYSCDRVIAPTGVAGTGRNATLKDLPLLLDFSREFAVEAMNAPTHWSVADTEAETRRLERRVNEGKVFLWCDSDPVSQTYVTGATPNGIRVTGVYTPPIYRGKGYASACVAALTNRLLSDGKKFVFLFTDLTNPTSNGIYRKIGYQYVGSAVDVALLPLTR